MPLQERSPSIIMYVDGGARGNPGPAAYAVVVQTAEGKPVATLSKFLGHSTNNVAEYEGLLAALEYALKHRYLRLRVRSDSELLVRQMKGLYKVKSVDLKPLHAQARQMIAQLKAFSIDHIPRAQNREADGLVNQALDAAEAGRARPALRPAPSTTLRAAATYQRGALKLQRALPLFEGEEVELEIHRKR